MERVFALVDLRDLLSLACVNRGFSWRASSDAVWTDRPAPSPARMTVHADTHAGQSSAAKRAAMREEFFARHFLLGGWPGATDT